MKSMLFMLSLIVLISFSCFSQDTTLEVVAAAGNDFQNASYGISWTLGETVTVTGNTDSRIMTQGFQQSQITVTAIKQVPGMTFKLNVYPNPADDHVFLVTSLMDFDLLTYELYDSKGAVIDRNTMSSDKTQIDLQNEVSGMYYLRVMKNSQVLETFKILKQ